MKTVLNVVILTLVNTFYVVSSLFLSQFMMFNALFNFDRLHYEV